MKIGVVADTHSRPLPAQLIADFQKVDLIVHAGDFCDLGDYEALVKIKDVKAVQGNMDSPAVCKKFPKRQILECGRFRLGVIHGVGSPEMVLPSVQEAFKKDKVNAVIFGHSHRALNEEINGVLYFNPGSPNDPVYAMQDSYGLLDITDKGISAKIVKVKKS